MSPPVPRQLMREPTDRTRRLMVNRPVREMAQGRPARPAYRSRPESRSSNVSRQRSRCGSLASSPMLRQRRVNISHEFTTGMAEVINQFTQQQNAALEEQKAKYHKYIKRLKRELAEESDVIAQQTSQISTQTHEIKDLQASREEMAGQLRDLKAKLGASEDRARKLEEKYRACKTHLNSAIQEQQDLYTRSKKHWEQMDALTQQLEEKEVELSRERESTRVLSEKLQRLQATSTGFEALAAQGKEILNRLGEQAKKTEEQRQKLADELRDRLDAVANRLEALSGMASSQSDALASLRQTQDESMNSVTIKLGNMLECREAAKNATTQLSTDLEINLAKVWQRLDNQLESLSKQLAEKSEENGMMSTLYRRKEAECEKHMKELAALRDTTEKQEQQIQDLDSSLFALDAAHEESEDKIRRLEESAAETAQLREELKSKAAVVAELQSKLDAQDRAHASELHTYTSDIRKLVQALQEKDLSSGIAAQQAAEAARCEIRLEMEKANSKTERLLHETEQQRNALASQVEELKQELREKEQADSRNSATIHSLQERLSTAEAKQNTMTDEFTQRLASLGESESRLTSQVADLETELKATKDRAVELEGESRLQHARFEALIAGLKQWAAQVGLSTDGLNGLGDGNKSVEEIRAELLRALGQPQFSRRSQTLTPEEHTDLRPDVENSRFFSGGAGQSQTDVETHTALDQRTNGGADEALREGTRTEGVSDENSQLPYASTLHHMRRVVVRSPANAPSEPVAPSIDQEKMRRRGALQPKSIMKRVTRSTSSMMKQGESNSAAGHGAFKRNGGIESLQGTSALNGCKGRPEGTRVTPAPDLQPPENTDGVLSRRPSKRRRSETAKLDDSGRALGAPSQGKTTELSISGSVPAPQRAEPDFTYTALAGPQQGDPESHRRRHPSNASISQESRSTAAQNSRRKPGSGSQGSQRTASAHATQVLGPRQPNLRTYGSQRTSGEHRAVKDTQSSLESQSQTRYWQRLKESQDSITFSHGANEAENLLAAFRD
ncbi:uncharacterized protein THITE_2037083 [Thermothielavioides terrestris NRRL 8126]|uniref:Uncharacterized protein n=1 Tax=Thermothielavioides terrestris (strain ATCC 38088 / NRRL 8126) TaxID=578455 RepID=G2QXY8_THETT|nr:uncharacterized protein THITE_2037083 [Thermothielavioides terrestris NRRL 8126]AEO64055.1 hypothetical protein THITE_2037083 [Thermothielavioides terrestris NRRL 8126]